MHFSSVAAGALLFSLVSALPAPEQSCSLGTCDSPVVVKRSGCQNGICDDLAKRDKKPGVCYSDNLLRNLRDKRFSVSASAFCSTYIQSTATETSKVAATTTETTVTTPAGATVTTTNFATLPNTFVKRGQAYPTWLPATYVPESVSSACSCFVTPSAPVTVTTTITTGTNTVSVTETAPTPPTTTVAVDGNGYCGVPGCGNGQGIIRTALDEARTSSECIALCANTQSCQTVQFARDPSSSRFVCNLYRVPVPQAFYAGSSRDSYCKVYQFFDVRCKA